MSAARKLIDELAGYGARVYVEAGKVKVATRANLPDDLLSRLKEAREQIREALAPAYDPAALQREADRRNAEAAHNGSTERWCRCGNTAGLAWPVGNRREVWMCERCAPTLGRA